MIRLVNELIIHSHIDDCLPSEEPLANKDVFCEKCNDHLHSFNNECMQTWIETDDGNYCTKCFHLVPIIETIEDCL